MADFTELKKAVDEFAKAVVFEAMRNIGATQSVSKFRVARSIRKNFVYTGNLKSSLRAKVNKDLSIDFFVVGSAQKYAQVIEDGQMGISEAPTTDKYYMPTPNKFKMKKMPPSKVILKWMKKRSGFRFRDKDGKFKSKPTESQMKGIAYTIARAMQRRGRVGLHYFEHAYEDVLKAKREKLNKGLGSDIDKQLLAIFKKGGLI
jgi:hypothetical protein